MPAKPGDSTRPVMLTADAARRIGKAVQSYEQGHPRMRGKLLRTASDGGGEIRLGRITGSWAKNDTATVTRLRWDGTLWQPQQTFQAVNHFADISVDCGERKVACAQVDNGWILIAAECGTTAGS